MKYKKICYTLGLMTLLSCGMPAAKSDEPWCKRFLRRQHAQYALQYDQLEQSNKVYFRNNSFNLMMLESLHEFIHTCEGYPLTKTPLDAYLKEQIDIYKNEIEYRKNLEQKMKQLDRIFEEAGF